MLEESLAEAKWAPQFCVGSMRGPYKLLHEFGRVKIMVRLKIKPPGDIFCAISAHEIIKPDESIT